MTGRRQMQKPKRNFGKGLLGALYWVAVGLSALIVVTFLLLKLLVHPPEIKQPVVNQPVVNGDVSAVGLDHGQGVVPKALARKELCYTFLLLGIDDGNGNADTIMVATYDVQEQTVGVVSVPRDTIVKQAGQGYPKINGVYAKGVDAMCTEVGKLLGIPIDYYLTVNLKGFVKLVDAVGGVDFNVPVDMDYDDPAQNLSIHYKKGVQHLNGQQALEVVRFRHNNIVTNNDYSDTERTQTQQKLVQAVMDKVISWGSIANIQQFLNICQSNIKTNLTANDWLYFAGQVLEMGADGTIITKTLSGRGDATHNGTKWCFELNKEQTLQDINDLLNPYTTPVTEEMANIIRANG